MVNLRALIFVLPASWALLLASAARAESDLIIAADGHTTATVAVSPAAGVWEKRAATDLVHYISVISGATPTLADKPELIAAALGKADPLFLIGKVALATDPSLSDALAKAAKPNPLLRADAIVLRRHANRVFLAGNNDDSQYYAVTELLNRWGCRWYIPTDIGECVPHRSTLKLGELDYAYGSPFEVRHYWLAWDGDSTGIQDFAHRNFFNEVGVPNGHNLGNYTKELIPPGKTVFNVPISDPKTAEHVAAIALPDYVKGKDIMLGLEDGVYQSDSPQDKALIALQYDKHFLTQSYTDAFMVMYNNIANILMKKAPESKSHIGFLIYSNITLPPVKDIVAAKPLVAYLAPIDYDPIHGMDDPHATDRKEYRDILYKWAKVMQGRLVIYDYDQTMLVWRDLPNPSHHAFSEDVQHYRDAKVLGVDTESRGATATVFTNLYVRGQLTWNPDLKIDALLSEFFPKFYGPVAEPMQAYWNAIFKAWENTTATEHEYFVAPAIYTPGLIATLRGQLEKAEAIIKTLPVSPEGKQYVDRVALARQGFEVIDAYMAMVHAAAADVDYHTAVDAGHRGLAARDKLTAMNGTYTTYKVIGENGYAWWPGEVQQYNELLPFTDGAKGALVAKTPLVWNFRRDPGDVGSRQGWEKQPVDLSWWKSLLQPVSVEERQKNDGRWEQLRTDIYAQGQGVLSPDFSSYTGFGWYQTDLALDASQTAGPVHLKFPGLFNECWLYINGEQIAHREFKGVWWMNDYRFEWDVDLTGKLKAGQNSIVLRINNPHHFGGIFRRPFLYRATGK